MDRMPDRLARWWMRLDDRGRQHASALAAIGIIYVVHYLVYCLPQPFFIEDAGISFTYAEHMVEGEGLVPYPGGERVEGYSNALWTFLVALFYGLGIPTWTSAKIMGALFGLATLPFSYGLVIAMRPGRSDHLALAAPLMLALSPQFVIWNASGLENALYVLLLSAAMWRTVKELTTPDGLFPWSALLYMLLTATRPEGMMYAGIGGFCYALDAIATRRWRPVAKWLLVFAVPFALYNAWRYWYFAWAFPNTYYAKLGKGNSFKPFLWSGGGWKYVKRWMVDHGIVYEMPEIEFLAQNKNES